MTGLSCEWLYLVWGRIRWFYRAISLRGVVSFLKLGWLGSENVLQVKHFDACTLYFLKSRGGWNHHNHPGNYTPEPDSVVKDLPLTKKVTDYPTKHNFQNYNQLSLLSRIELSVFKNYVVLKLCCLCWYLTSGISRK